MEEFHHPALLAGNGVLLFYTFTIRNIQFSLENLILLLGKSLILLLDGLDKSPFRRMAA